MPIAASRTHTLSNSWIMVNSATTAATETPSGDQGSIVGPRLQLCGKRAAMVMFSHYPADPRPRRAAEALLREGMQIDLVCLAEEDAPGKEQVDGIEVLRVPLKRHRGGKLAYIYQYSAFILISTLVVGWRALTRGYDLVYVHNMPDILVLSGVIPKALGAKVILDLHDPMPELMTTIFGLNEDSAGVRFISRAEKWSLARADAVITVSIACKRIFSSRSCSAEKIQVIMNSPDEEIFQFRAADSYPRADQGRSKPFVIMYHGSLVERNGLDLAVEALALVRDAIPTAQLRVYGPNSAFLDRVLEMAKSKGVDKAIHYLGPKRLEELVHEIQACDIGIIPNQKNSFTAINTPTRIFEYLSLGKPVIAPSTPGILDYFNEESLLFFEPGSPKDLAQKIEYAYSHPSEVLDIARKGQQVYLEHRWSQERQTLVNQVSGLLNGR